MTTVAPEAARPPIVLVVDIGTSSLRAILFDAQARAVAGSLVQISYSPRLTPDGGAELDAPTMFDAFVAALDGVLERAGHLEIAVVAASSLASNVLGIDARGDALTPVYLYSDTRDSAATQELGEQFDWAPIYARTGCPLHASYLPARFLWLRESHPDLFRSAARWLSLHEYFMLRVLGRPVVSHSLASWTGLFNREQLDWDRPLLSFLQIGPEQLSPLAPVSAYLTGPLPAYASRWPPLAGARWSPAAGDGATANLGSGCGEPSRIAVTIGTSGALRVVVPSASFSKIPAGLWLYTIDERRALLGGSLNNGGNVFAFLQRLLRLEPDAESRLQVMEPAGHGLTVLPFFAGERSTGYHGSVLGAIAGMSLDTSPLDILQASYEAVAYRLAAIFDRVLSAVPPPSAIIGSGGALVHSPAWAHIIADVLGHTLVLSGEKEATARGAALLALQARDAIGNAGELEAELGPVYEPNPEHREPYQRGRARHQKLYSLLVEGQPLESSGLSGPG